MASIGATLAGLNARYLRPRPEEVHADRHLKQVQCEINLAVSDLVSPFKEIIGTVTISNEKPLPCQCIFIQLTATVELDITVKLDRQLTSTCKRKGGLISGSETTQGGLIVLSPTRQVLVNEWGSSYTIQIPPGKHLFPFTLCIPAEPLPAPFKSKFGHLQYKLGVVMENLCCFAPMAERQLSSAGYRNLVLEPKCNFSAVSEGALYTSFFSTRPLLSCKLTANRTGFLPKESVSFILCISNPQQTLVKKVTCSLIQKATYNGSVGKKATSIQLDTFEINEQCNDVEMNLVGRLRVPRNCIPSFTSWIYSLHHVVQYVVEIEEHSTPLKKELQIVVGTTRASEEELIQREKEVEERRESAIRTEDVLRQDEAEVRRKRSQSVVSTISTDTISSLPPNYSQLESHTASVRSLDTLPPQYDDLFK